VTKNGKRVVSNEVKVLVVAHCVLNRSTRWWRNGRPLEKNQGPVREILEFLAKYNIGAFQLPCPEFTAVGNPRPPATKDDYLNVTGFKEHCRRLAVKAAEQLRTLVQKSRNPRIKIMAIVGVERSPTCGVKSTPRTLNGETRFLCEKGIFLEMLEKEISKNGLKVPIIGLDMRNPKSLCRELEKLANAASIM